MTESDALYDFDDIAAQIRMERRRQIEKWGTNHHPPDTYIRVLGEEFGEVCRAANDRQWHNYREELIQVAAVAVRMVQSFDAQRGAINEYVIPGLPGQ